MRNMSFSLTTNQILAGIKTVTRRFGWWFLKPGDLVRPVEKSMGLKKGERVKPLCGPLRIVSVRTEPLHCITDEDCVLEGFPDMNPAEFVDMLCRHYHCHQNQHVNRIEFEYTDTGQREVVSRNALRKER